MAGAGPRERAVDALRGLALFGIVLVNGPYFAGPAALIPASGGPDLIAQALVGILAAGKFFPIYSFLFGFGLATLAARGGPAGRRLPVLGVIGAVHAVALFYGDILMLYALLGPLVLIAARLGPRGLIGLGVAALGLGILAQVAISVATQDLWMEALRRPVVPGEGYLGGFAAVTAERLRDLPGALVFTLVFNGPVAFAMMLFGVAAARSGVFPARLPRPGLTALLGGVGLLLSAVGHGLSLAASDGAATLGILLLCLGAPPLSAAIVVAVASAAQAHPDHALTRALAGVGAQALTGYLAHSVLFGALVYGWGLGLYGSIGAAAVLGLSVAVYATILVLVALWTAAFGRGPAERLFRWLARG